MDKIKIAQNRIREMLKWYAPKEVYVGHSGGKDSSAVLHLTQSIYPDIQVIHNGKKIFDPKDGEISGPTDVHIDTLRFFYEYTLGTAPFVTLVKTEKMGQYLKNHDQIRVQIDGTRIDEFERDAKSNTFEINGVQVSRESMKSHWHQNGLFGLNFLCPIYDWSSEDVFEYHKLNNIPLSPEYENDQEYKKWLSK